MCSLRCSICLEAAKDKQDETGWAVLGCGHVFHAHCLQQSLEHKKSCPNCRVCEAASFCGSRMLLIFAMCETNSLSRTPPFTTSVSLVQKSVKSAKGAQPLFLDLVPAMPSTPMAKGGATGDSTRSFASQEALTALAETLAKRDAEVSQLSAQAGHICNSWAAAPACMCFIVLAHWRKVVGTKQ